MSEGGGYAREKGGSVERDGTMCMSPCVQLRINYVTLRHTSTSHVAHIQMKQTNLAASYNNYHPSITVDKGWRTMVAA